MTRLLPVADLSRDDGGAGRAGASHALHRARRVADLRRRPGQHEVLTARPDLTATNFGSLKLAWRAKSPDGFLSLTLADGTEWSADSKLIFDELSRIDPKRWRDGQPPFVQNYKATPLMVNGTLYVNTAASVGAAYDARTGALKWVYNPKSYESGTTTPTLRWNQRGVARPTCPARRPRRRNRFGAVRVPGRDRRRPRRLHARDSRGGGQGR